MVADYFVQKWKNKSYVPSDDTIQNVDEKNWNTAFDDLEKQEIVNGAAKGRTGKSPPVRYHVSG